MIVDVILATQAPQWDYFILFAGANTLGVAPIGFEPRIALGWPLVEFAPLVADPTGRKTGEANYGLIRPSDRPTVSRNLLDFWIRQHGRLVGGVVASSELRAFRENPLF